MDRAIADKRTWLGAGRINNWIDRCVWLLTQSIIQTPYKLTRGKGKDAVEVEDHPVLELLTNPNPYDMKTWADLIGFAMRSVFLRGETQLELVPNRAGQPTQLYWLHPDMMTPVPDPKEFISGWRLQTGAGSVLLPKERVYWWRVANPMDRYGGLSVIEALRQSANLDISAIQVQASVYSNGGLVHGIVSPDDKDGVGFSQATMTEMQQEWRERTAGSRKAHSTVFISKPVKFQSLSLTSDEAQWIQTRAITRMEICSAFGVPLELATSESRSYDNLKSARQSFWQETMIPRLSWLADQINGSVVRAFDPDRKQNLKFEFKLDEVSALQPDWRDARFSENQAIQIGLRTINEVRAEKDMEPLAWGDSWWGPMSTVEIVNSDGKTPPRPALPMRPLPPGQDGGDGGGGGASGPSQSQPAGPGGRDSPVDPSNPGGRTASLPALRQKSPLRVYPTPEARLAIGKHRSDVINAEATRFRDAIKEAFRTQKEAIVAGLPRKSRKIEIDRVEQYYVPATADLFNAAGLMFESVGKAAYQATSEQINRNRKGAKDASDDVAAMGGPPEIVARAGVILNFRVDDPRLQAVAREIGVRITDIDSTTLKATREVIAEGLRRGYSRDQIADGYAAEDYEGLSGIFDGYEGYRAELIARTETSWAYTQASLASYAEAGKDVVPQKEWLLGMGDATHICDDLDGTVVDVDEQFDLPDGDSVDGPPAHPNCTCTVLPVLPDGSDGGDDGGDEGEMAREPLAIKAAVSDELTIALKELREAMLEMRAVAPSINITIPEQKAAPAPINVHVTMPGPKEDNLK